MDFNSLGPPTSGNPVYQLKIPATKVPGQVTENCIHEIRLADQRGHANHGWLDSWHSFSFGDYLDPEHVEYGSTIRPGDVQRMSAGTGVQHSEFNASEQAPVHFMQIWIQPNQKGITPSYEERAFGESEKRGRLRLIASPDRADGSLLIHRDARVYAGLFGQEAKSRLAVAPGRRIYLHVARGAIKANDAHLGTGDAMMLTGAAALDLADGRDAEVLAFDLP